jgi:hypothetical protein
LIAISCFSEAEASSAMLFTRGKATKGFYREHRFLDQSRLLHCVIENYLFSSVQVVLVYSMCDLKLRRNNKAQFRGKLNLIGRLQLSTEKNREEENQEIFFLRTERAKVKNSILKHSNLIADYEIFAFFETFRKPLLRYSRCASV